MLGSGTSESIAVFTSCSLHAAGPSPMTSRSMMVASEGEAGISICDCDDALEVRVSGCSDSVGGEILTSPIVVSSGEEGLVGTGTGWQSMKAAQENVSPAEAGECKHIITAGSSAQESTMSPSVTEGGSTCVTAVTAGTAIRRGDSGGVMRSTIISYGHKSQHERGSSGITP
jgi:hypothetical protein